MKTPREKARARMVAPPCGRSSILATSPSRTISRERSSEGLGPAIHTKMQAAAREARAALPAPISREKTSIASEHNMERCWPERARIWEQPASLNQDASVPSSPSLTPRRRATAKPEALPEQRSIAFVQAFLTRARTRRSGAVGSMGKRSSGRAKKSPALFPVLGASTDILEPATSSAPPSESTVTLGLCRGQLMLPCVPGPLTSMESRMSAYERPEPPALV
jgi:hypothetical protein